MMVTFDAPSGQRILRSRFLGIQTDSGLWWSYDKRRWLEDLGGGTGSNTAPCQTYKAFLRHIRKHPELTQATLVSRFVGHDIHYAKEPQP